MTVTKNHPRLSSIRKRLAFLFRECRGLMTLAMLSNFFFAGAISAAQNAIIVEGNYSEKTPNPLLAFNREASSQGTFRVSMQPPIWRISYQDLSAPADSSILYSAGDASFDGTNIYVMHDINPSLKDPQGHEPGTNFYWHRAEVYTGFLPPTSEPFLYNFWLAFISSTVLTNNHGTTKPFMNIDLSMFYDARYSCLYAWQDKSIGSWERKLELNSDGQWFQRNRKNGEPELIHLHEPYQNGFNLATALWKTQTNVADISIPVKYELTAYGLKHSATSNKDRELIYTFTCDVQNTAMKGDIPLIVPNAPTYVYDHRFTNLGYATVTYGATNGWLSTNNPNHKAIFLRSRKMSMETESIKKVGFYKPPTVLGLSKNAIVKLVILGVLILAPLPLLVMGLRKRKKNKQPFLAGY